MNRRSFLDVLNLDPQAFRVISSVLDRIETGWEGAILSPLALERDPLDILDGWDVIFNSNLSKMNEPLINIDSAQRDKYGSRSDAVPWSSRRESLTDSFGIGKRGLFLPSVIRPTRRLRPLSLESAVQFLKNQSSAGCPTFQKKGNVKGAMVADFKDQLAKRYPCALYTRTQEKKKTRNVWGWPISDTLNEMMVYRPVLDVQKKQSWRAALREPQDVDIAMTKLLDHAQITGIPNVSLDFGKYDNTCKKEYQNAAFKEIKGLFQDQFSDAIDYIADRFNTIGIITPDGIMSGPHGVPSGSAFTNEIDSIAQYQGMKKSGCVSNLEISQCQGDDGVCPSSRPDELFASFISDGFDINTEKVFINDNFIVFLQSLYHIDYRDNQNIVRGIYPTYRALLRIVFLERFDDFSKDGISGADYFAIRTISILEQCKHHPLFRDLVKYIWSLDKYKLSVSDLGLSAYVNARLSKEGKDVNFRNWSYGQDVAGIKAFESFKIIAELNK